MNAVTDRYNVGVWRMPKQEGIVRGLSDAGGEALLEPVEMAMADRLTSREAWPASS